jgi:TPR repeat protein
MNSLEHASNPDLTPEQFRALLDLEDEFVYEALDLNDSAAERYMAYLETIPDPIYIPFEDLTDEELNRRAQADDHLAQFELGHRASKQGELEVAANWFLRAAQNGNIVCAHNYAVDVESDDEAYYWFRKAGFKGFAMSQRQLGHMYKKHGDIERARIWYGLACRRGLIDAYSELGMLHWEQGQSEIATEIWYAGSIEGDEKCREYLNLHNPEMLFDGGLLFDDDDDDFEFAASDNTYTPQIEKKEISSKSGLEFF